MKLSALAIRFIVLAFLAMLLLNFPFLSTANKLQLPLGLPNLYLYIFVAWIIIIVMAAYFTRNTTTKQKPEEQHD